MRPIVIGLAALSVLASSPVCAAVVKNHPAVTPYAGSVATRRDDDGFKSYALVTAVNEKGKSDEEVLQTLKVSGNLIRFSYENPKDRSAHEIYTNYREGLEKGGFQILYACIEKECGPSHATSRWGRVTGLRFFSPEMRYIAAKGSKNGQEIYVAVLVAKLRHQVEIVEAAPMEKGLVTAKALAEGLRLEGRVVLEGIFFDTDKATIKAESKPALLAIKAFLTENAALRAYIVGHTDGTGEFGHNMQLSKDRAAAVVAALVNEYKIAPERLSAHGVGPLSPARTNKTDAGRTHNRRVELVER
ncbi:Outer membrane protein Omp38 [Burkholderiales bacterium]|jgi:outer membrane protein OmpA-like peptidoglycan-associated protein|nr:Outer membrane protein Omp38 [Burkholderiales bacterium]